MKKLISLVLCIMMVSSLFAMNVSASIAIGDEPETLYPINQDFEDAENSMFTTCAWPNGSGAVAVETVDGNSYADVYLGGDGDTSTLDIAYIGSGNLDGVAPNEGYTMTFDVYPVNTSVSLRVLHNNDVTNGQGTKYGFVIPASVFPTMNQWYSVKVVVAEPFVNQDVSIAVYVKSEADADYTKIAHSSLYSPAMWAGHSFLIGAESRYNQNNAATADSTRYKIDNVVLYHSTDATEYPSTGVLYNDNFEGVSVLASGMGSTVKENGNSYLKLNHDGTGYNGSGYATATSIPEKFILTMDVYKEASCAGPLVFEYWQSDVLTSGVWGQIGIYANAVEAGEWYTLKIAKTAADRTYTVTLEDAEGNVTTPETANVLNAAVGITGNNPSQFVFRGWSNFGAINWRVDNIVLTEAAAVSLPSITAEDDAVSVEISADAISAKVAPILALYNGNILVDVDWDAVDVATDGASAELEVSGEYDEAKIFLWDKFENGTPLLINPWDITEIIAE